MVINGAGFLLKLADRVRLEGAVVTEAHPKATYFALTGRQPAFDGAAEEMVRWLGRELGLALPAAMSGGADHQFDATMAALASLRGLNRDWTRDLHALDSGSCTAIRFFGRTHYWWPG